MGVMFDNDEKEGFTYRFLEVPLDDSKFARVDCVLHDEPRQCFLVFAVHLTGFYELCAQLLDAFLVLLGVEVDDDCVYHGCGSLARG
jgi:hypothetical protein